MNRFIRVCVSLVLLIATARHAIAQPATQPTTRRLFTIPPGLKIGSFVNRPESFYTTDEGRRIAENISGWQNPNGGWFKNYNPATTRPAVLDDDPRSGPPGDDDSVWHKVSTIDNGATYGELRVLARAFTATHDARYKTSFDRGLKYLLDAQYPNGGWPQRFPLQDNYGRHITYNDGAMTSVMQLMQDVAEGKGDFAFTGDEQRQMCRKAFDRGLQCILDCQYKRDGKLTAWGQQHDEVTLAPAGARTYELPSLCGSESAGILTFLMSLPNPNQRIRDAVDAGFAWYESSRIHGKRLTNSPNGRSLVDDPSAPVLWARFYDLRTNKPFVSGRDGIPKESLEEIPAERRNGYSWYGPYGNSVEEAYPAWKSHL